MPCHPARARELVRAGKALRRFNKGMFYIKLTERQEGFIQPVALGIDPGSKWEGFTIKAAARTFIHINADAVTWVKDAVETRRNMRRTRRNRNTPYRQCRANRAVKPNHDGFRLPPSTFARWDFKLRISKWLSQMFPIACSVVEDIKAETRKGCKKWNTAFSPMEQGKLWFYQELGKLCRVETRQGFETFEMRNQMGLKKLKDKKSKSFYAHCVDSWTLANWFVGGHTKPDFEKVMCLTPFQWHRRQLHKLQPAAGGIRKREGSTNSLGFKRGSLVKHVVKGLCYVGGFMGKHLSLHSVQTGKRLGQNFKPEDCKFLAHSGWRLAWA